MTISNSNSISDQFDIRSAQRSESSNDRTDALGISDEDESFNPEFNQDELSSEAITINDGKSSDDNLQVCVLLSSKISFLLSKILLKFNYFFVFNI
jgi:hypothetical protein